MLLHKQTRLKNASILSYWSKGNSKPSPIQHRPPKFNAIRTLNVCRVAISPLHKISYTASGILKDTSHVLHAPTRQRYEVLLNGEYDKRKEGLWIVFTSNPMHSKKVVRSWVKRRVALAIVEELKRRGFDKKGRRLADVEGKQVPEVLIGTVDIEVMKKCVEAEHAEVQRQAGLVVQAILKICGGHQRNDHARVR